MLQEDEDKMSKVPYASTIGILMYAMVCTSPDITHVVGVISRCMSHLGIEGSTTNLQGYVDSNLVEDIDTRQNTTGYVFTVGGVAVSRVSRLQKVNALSIIEAEYVAAIEVTKDMIWLQFFQ